MTNDTSKQDLAGISSNSNSPGRWADVPEFAPTPTYLGEEDLTQPPPENGFNLTSPNTTPNGGVNANLTSPYAPDSPEAMAAQAVKDSPMSLGQRWARDLVAKSTPLDPLELQAHKLQTLAKSKETGISQAWGNLAKLLKDPAAAKKQWAQSFSDYQNQLEGSIATTAINEEAAKQKKGLGYSDLIKYGTVLGWGYMASEKALEVATNVAGGLLDSAGFDFAKGINEAKGLEFPKVQDNPNESVDTVKARAVQSQINTVVAGSIGRMFPLFTGRDNTQIQEVQAADQAAEMVKGLKSREDIQKMLTQQNDFSTKLAAGENIVDPSKTGGVGGTGYSYSSPKFLGGSAKRGWIFGETNYDLHRAQELLNDLKSDEKNATLGIGSSAFRNLLSNFGDSAIVGFAVDNIKLNDPTDPKEVAQANALANEINQVLGRSYEASSLTGQVTGSVAGFMIPGMAATKVLGKASHVVDSAGKMVKVIEKGDDVAKILETAGKGAKIVRVSSTLTEAIASTAVGADQSFKGQTRDIGWASRLADVGVEGALLFAAERFGDRVGEHAVQKMFGTTAANIQGMKGALAKGLLPIDDALKATITKTEIATRLAVNTFGTGVGESFSEFGENVMRGDPALSDVNATLASSFGIGLGMSFLGVRGAVINSRAEMFSHYFENVIETTKAAFAKIDAQPEATQAQKDLGKLEYINNLEDPAVNRVASALFNAELLKAKVADSPVPETAKAAADVAEKNLADVVDNISKAQAEKQTSIDEKMIKIDKDIVDLAEVTKIPRDKLQAVADADLSLLAAIADESYQTDPTKKAAIEKILGPEETWTSPIESTFLKTSAEVEGKSILVIPPSLKLQVLPPPPTSETLDQGTPTNENPAKPDSNQLPTPDSNNANEVPVAAEVPKAKVLPTPQEEQEIVVTGESPKIKAPIIETVKQYQTSYDTAPASQNESDEAWTDYADQAMDIAYRMAVFFKGGSFTDGQAAASLIEAMTTKEEIHNHLFPENNSTTVLTDLDEAENTKKTTKNNLLDEVNGLLEGGETLVSAIQLLQEKEGKAPLSQKNSNIEDMNVNLPETSNEWMEKNIEPARKLNPERTHAWDNGKTAADFALFFDLNQEGVKKLLATNGIDFSKSEVSPLSPREFTQKFYHNLRATLTNKYEANMGAITIDIMIMSMENVAEVYALKPNQETGKYAILSLTTIQRTRESNVLRSFAARVRAGIFTDSLDTPDLMGNEKQVGSENRLVPVKYEDNETNSKREAFIAAKLPQLAYDSFVKNLMPQQRAAIAVIINNHPVLSKLINTGNSNQNVEDAVASLAAASPTPLSQQELNDYRSYISQQIRFADTKSASGLLPIFTQHIGNFRDAGITEQLNEEFERLYVPPQYVPVPKSDLQLGVQVTSSQSQESVAGQESVNGVEAQSTPVTDNQTETPAGTVGDVSAGTQADLERNPNYVQARSIIEKIIELKKFKYSNNTSQESGIAGVPLDIDGGFEGDESYEIPELTQRQIELVYEKLANFYKANEELILDDPQGEFHELIDTLVAISSNGLEGTDRIEPISDTEITFALIQLAAAESTITDEMRDLMDILGFDDSITAVDQLRDLLIQRLQDANNLKKQGEQNESTTDEIRSQAGERGTNNDALGINQTNGGNNSSPTLPGESGRPVSQQAQAPAKADDRITNKVYITSERPAGINANELLQNFPEFEKALDSEQQLDVAIAVKQMAVGDKASPGVFVANGPGTGKTRIGLAVAKVAASKGQKVIYVTSRIARGELNGINLANQNFLGDAAAVGVPVTAYESIKQSKRAPNPGEVIVMTYDSYLDAERVIDNDTVLIFDEAHNIKNASGEWGIAWNNAIAQAHSMLFMSGSPLDNMDHIEYLKYSGFFEADEEINKQVGDKGSPDATHKAKREALLKKLGYIKIKSSWVPDPDLAPSEIERRIKNHVAVLIKSGRYITRSLDLSPIKFIKTSVQSVEEMGVDGKTILVDIQQKHTEILNLLGWKEVTDIDDNGKLRTNLQKKVLKARNVSAEIQALNYTEVYRAKAAIPSIIKAIQNGEQVVVFTNITNDGAINPKNGGPSIPVASPTSALVDTLKTELAKAGYPNEVVSTLFGDGKSANPDLVANFNNGRSRILIATRAKAGEGLNLDDKVGNAPRHVIFLTPTLSAVQEYQNIMRVWRKDSKSAPTIELIDSGTSAEAYATNLLDSKMQILGANLNFSSQDVGQVRFNTQPAAVAPTPGYVTKEIVDSKTGKKVSYVVSEEIHTASQISGTPAFYLMQSVEERLVRELPEGASVVIESSTYGDHTVFLDLARCDVGGHGVYYMGINLDRLNKEYSKIVKGRRISLKLEASFKVIANEELLHILLHKQLGDLARGQSTDGVYMSLYSPFDKGMDDKTRLLIGKVYNLLVNRHLDPATQTEKAREWAQLNPDASVGGLDPATLHVAPNTLFELHRMLMQYALGGNTVALMTEFNLAKNTITSPADSNAVINEIDSLMKEIISQLPFEMQDFLGQMAAQTLQAGDAVQQNHPDLFQSTREWLRIWTQLVRPSDLTTDVQAAMAYISSAPVGAPPLYALKSLVDPKTAPVISLTGPTQIKLGTKLYHQGMMNQNELVGGALSAGTHLGAQDFMIHYFENRGGVNDTNFMVERVASFPPLLLIDSDINRMDHTFESVVSNPSIVKLLGQAKVDEMINQFIKQDTKIRDSGENFDVASVNLNNRMYMALDAELVKHGYTDLYYETQGESAVANHLNFNAIISTNPNNWNIIQSTSTQQYFADRAKLNLGAKGLVNAISAGVYEKAISKFRETVANPEINAFRKFIGTEIRNITDLDKRLILSALDSTHTKGEKTVNLDEVGDALDTLITNISNFMTVPTRFTLGAILPNSSSAYQYVATVQGPITFTYSGQMSLSRVDLRFLAARSLVEEAVNQGATHIIISDAKASQAMALATMSLPKTIKVDGVMKEVFPLNHAARMFMAGSQTVSPVIAPKLPVPIDSKSNEEGIRKMVKSLGLYAPANAHDAVKQILENADKVGMSAIQKAVYDVLAQSMEANLRDVGVRFSHEPNADWGAYYDPNSNLIRVNLAATTNPKALAQLIAHEAVHAILSKWIDTYSKGTQARAGMPVEMRKAISDLHKLHQHVLKTLGATESGVEAIIKKVSTASPANVSDIVSGWYGLTNLDEFVSEILTNPTFQKVLASIPAPKSFGSKISSIWNRIVDAVRRALSASIGQEIPEGSALDKGINSALAAFSAAKKVGVTKNDVTPSQVRNLQYANKAIIPEAANGEIKQGSLNTRALAEAGVAEQIRSQLDPGDYVATNLEVAAQFGHAWIDQYTDASGKTNVYAAYEAFEAGLNQEGVTQTHRTSINLALFNRFNEAAKQSNDPRFSSVANAIFNRMSESARDNGTAIALLKMFGDMSPIQQLNQIRNRFRKSLDAMGTATNSILIKISTEGGEATETAIEKIINSDPVKKLIDVIEKNKNKTVTERVKLGALIASLEKSGMDKKTLDISKNVLAALQKMKQIINPVGGTNTSGQVGMAQGPVDIVAADALFTEAISGLIQIGIDDKSTMIDLLTSEVDQPTAAYIRNKFEALYEVVLVDLTNKEAGMKSVTGEELLGGSGNPISPAGNFEIPTSPEQEAVQEQIIVKALANAMIMRVESLEKTPAARARFARVVSNFLQLARESGGLKRSPEIKAAIEAQKAAEIREGSRKTGAQSMLIMLNTYPAMMEAWKRARVIVENTLDADGKAQLGQLMDPVLSTPFSLSSVKMAIEDMSSLPGGESIKVRDLLKRSLHDQAVTGQKLADILLAHSDLNEDQVAEAAKYIFIAYRNVLKTERQKYISSLIKRVEAKKDRLPKKVKSALEKLTEYNNLGDLTNPEFYEAIKESLGLPAFTREISKQISSYIEEIQKLPEGRIRDKKINEMNSYIKQRVPESWDSWLVSYQTMNVLSGLGTQAINFGGSFMLGVSDIGISTMTGAVTGKPAKVIGGLKAYLALIKALTPTPTKDHGWFGAEAWVEMKNLWGGDFSNTVELLTDQIRSENQIETAAKATRAGLPVKIKVPPSLTWMINKFGPTLDIPAKMARPALEVMSFVQKLIVSSDTLNKTGFKRAREVMDAYAMASDVLGRTASMEAIDAYASEMLGHTKEAMDKATAQLAQEESDQKKPYDSLDKIIRLREIITQNRPEAAQGIDERAGEYGRVVGLANDPYGLVGVGVNAINYLPNKVKVAGLFIKFIRTAGNLLNETLNFVPGISMKRLIYGSGNLIITSDRARASYAKAAPTGVDFDIQLGKTIISHVGTLILLAMMEAFSDDDDPPFQINVWGPSSPAAKQKFKETGGKLFSLQFGRMNGEGSPTYLSFEAVPPGLAGLFLPVGIYYENKRYGKNVDKESGTPASFAKALLTTIFAAPAMLLNRQMLSGIADPLDIIKPNSIQGDYFSENWNKKIGRYGGRMASGFIPFIPWLKDINVLVDNNARYKADDMTGAFLAEIPFVKSSGGKPELNIFSSPITTPLINRLPVIKRFITVGTGKTKQDDETRFLSMMAKNNYSPNFGNTTTVRVWDEKLGEVIKKPTTPDQRYEIFKTTGPLFFKSLQENEKELKDITDPAEFKSVVSKMASAARQQALNELIESGKIK